MRRDRDGGRFRRYLLGAATDAEREAIDLACFERADGVDAVSAAEDDLIADYLSGRLERDERERFDRHYLSSPGHRRRVVVMRAIADAAAATPLVERRGFRVTWWAAGLAAAVSIVVVGAAWISSLSKPVAAPAETTAAPTSPAAGVPQVDTGSVPRNPTPDLPSRGPAPAPAEPTVIALAISPILVRGADQPATVTIPRGTDLVRLVLLGEPGERDLGGWRAIVQTVAGREIWRGGTRKTALPARRERAHVDIPAALLLPDDYVVQLLGTDSSGTELERYRYFFSVRVP